jgi:hypothetical protein
MESHTRILVLALALAGLASFGSNCRCSCIPPVVKILAPADGAQLEGCEVEILLHAGGGADPDSLSAKLNGVPIALERVPGRRAFFEATVPVGPESPLADSNTLVASLWGELGQFRASTVSFEFSEAGARARRITDESDLITGPQGDSRIGDWLLENCQARFVVQDAPLRDLTGIGQYGGNLIDAELRSRPGMDNFFEMQPMINIETVINADRVEIVNDGSDGNAAVVRSCGPDDTLDYINANTRVDDLLGPGSFPSNADDVDQDVEGCTEYILGARDSFLEVTTTIENFDSAPSAHHVGDFINGSGELEQWTRESASANPAGLSSLIGEMFANLTFDIFSYHGFGRAEGTSYGYIPLTFPGGTESSSFSTSGVSAVLHSNAVITVLFLKFPPLFTVDPQGTDSFTRYFNVGDGSAGNAVDLKIALDGSDSGTLRGCVTAGGEPAPGARVAAGLMADGTIEDLRSHWVTDEQGCYQGKLEAPASYGVAAAVKGVPYEGGGPTPTFHTVVMGVGDDQTLDIALPATGRVQVDVVDESGAPVPARIGVVGSDPSPEIINRGSIAGALDIATSLFHDATDDPVPDGLVWVAYAGADGAAAFDLEPGSYDIWVSRGTEYSAYSESVSVPAAPAPPVTVSAQIARVLDTEGFVSSDFHVHMIASSDSTIRNENRVLQFAGEGVDNIIATDHDRHTDLNPDIELMGLQGFVHATVGEEITTFDYGHFNAYPLGIDPDRVTGGSTDWAGPAEIGKGFPSSSPPSYALLPSQIFDEVFATTRVAGGILNDSPELAVQVNHFGSHFGPLKIDSGDLPLRSQLSPLERATRRFDPAAADTDFFHEFDALEIWNGHHRGHQDEFLVQRVGVWMNLLNQGIKITPIFDTDTHEFFNVRSGGARSWTPASSDEVALIDDEEIGAAVKRGKVVGGQGIYLQARLVATNDPDTVASFALDRETQISVADGEVTLEIEVQAPTWAPYDTIEIYRNASTTITASNGGVPVEYTANPTETLESFMGDFAVDTVTVHPGVPGAERLETTLSRSYSLAQDAWFAVIVKGTDANSASMFPVMPADLSRSGGVRALGATSALYVDVGDDGAFDAPGVVIEP